MKTGYVYIMSNSRRTTFYTGVTSDLVTRIYQHRYKEEPSNSFCYRYNLTDLIYYEMFSDISTAIAREKAIKKYSRQDKIKLILKTNPKLEDLYNQID